MLVDWSNNSIDDSNIDLLVALVRTGAGVSVVNEERYEQHESRDGSSVVVPSVLRENRCDVSELRHSAA